MRTNVVLDEKLVKEAMKLTGKKTKRELIDYALHELVKRQKRLALLDLRGKLKWEGDLDAMKATR
ncbi:MAG TPA: type II toxin-antitoxin system VapB family antitoxin [Turneriella sp.]|nr:type II toxin-antitoxin system VapB family antitoxin [Turneriella sp.]HNE20568.1 type II toxin-antitoxin system VapB family antitoxin [Turneriella sp.]HNJ67410.1 type II toxin-antitoxin system VapB family antitoxin [Turneriella sp.]HNL55850.1 type II toxin-antitoxin system VapB family antitoxin [Turneriella sp.]